MFRAQGAPTYLGTGLSADEDPLAGQMAPDVDMIAMQYYNPNRAAVAQRIGNYNVDLVEREQRINGLGAAPSGRLTATVAGQPKGWMAAMNRVKQRTGPGRPAVRQRFIDGLGAIDPVTGQQVVSTTTANTPYMVISDPNAPFVLYAQNAEVAPYQPFALYRQYRPAAENVQQAKGSEAYPGQWGFLGVLPIGTPYIYPLQPSPSLTRDTSPANAPAITAASIAPTARANALPSNLRSGSSAMTRSIALRKAVIEAGYKVGVGMGLRLPATVPTVADPIGFTIPQTRQALPSPKTVERDPLMQRSLFVEY